MTERGTLNITASTSTDDSCVRANASGPNTALTIRLSRRTPAARSTRLTVNCAVKAVASSCCSRARLLGPMAPIRLMTPAAIESDAIEMPSSCSCVACERKPTPAVPRTSAMYLIRTKPVASRVRLRTPPDTNARQ